VGDSRRVCFNAAPVKGAQLSLSIVRTTPKAVNQPRVEKTKMLWVLPESHI
jgi:hypothetical protein